MQEPIRCKRIINGRTYNTETATLLGYGGDPNAPFDQALFKTRFGAYFFYFLEHDCTEHIEPAEPQRAQEWMEKNCSSDNIEAEFGEMPEAGDPEARVTLRIPESLRRRAANIAEARDQSLNAWLLRCIERGVSDGEQTNG